MAKNAEKTIRYAVESLIGQTVKPHEIIIVVDSPEDPTLEAIKDLPVKIITNDGVGLGSARKKGVEASSGDIVAFIDADCMADRRWIESLLRAFSLYNDVMVQAGRTVYVKSFSEIPDGDESLSESRSNPSFLKFAPTQNFAFKREVIGIIGNFDPEFKSGGEDLDFCIRLRKAGIRIHYNPDAVVYHLKRGFSPRSTWRDGRSRAHAFIKHGVATLSDALTSLFHSISLIALIGLLVIGNYTLAVSVFMPSLMHRLYRTYINIKRGNNGFASLINSFIAYISHISFLVSLPTFTLKKLISFKRGSIAKLA